MSEPADRHSIDEAQLAEIWCRYLAVDRIDSDDDFFAIGGTSLQAAQIFSAIKDATGIDLPITVLLATPTIRQLAGYLRTHEKTDHSCLVLLKPGDEHSTPVFLIHPVGGSVLVYRELANALDIPNAVYGIQAVGMVAGRPPHTSVEEMARYYCDQLAAVQPNGPCHLVGYSGGGVVAYAMAQRLLQIGRRVRYLGLINSHFSFRRIGRETGLFQRLPAYVRYVRARGLFRAIGEFVENLRYQRQLKTAEAMLDAKGATPQQRHQKLVKQILEKNTDRYTTVQQLQQIAINHYQPSPYPGVINLYKTADYHDNRPGEIGWERLAGGGLKVTPVPGTHLTLVRDDNALALAAILSGQLAAVNER